MKIINQKPPNWREVWAEFFPSGDAPKGVIFCYGKCIYNPTGVIIPPHLIKHEEVHSEQQGKDPDEWWKKYIADPVFRLEQEIPAHQVEWQEYMKHHPDRPHRRFYLRQLSHRLAGRLYGNLITVANAKKAIKEKSA